jgi:hypothetical protein
MFLAELFSPIKFSAWKDHGQLRNQTCDYLSKHGDIPFSLSHDIHSDATFIQMIRGRYKAPNTEEDAKHEGTHQAGSKAESQSGTMKSLQFFNMLKTSIDGGIQSQTWIDAGCGAGIILLFSMVYNFVVKRKINKFVGFDMDEAQTINAQRLLKHWQELTREPNVKTSVIGAKFPDDQKQITEEEVGLIIVLFGQ